jgi:hypothetical protein
MSILIRSEFDRVFSKFLRRARPTSSTGTASRPAEWHEDGPEARSCPALPQPYAVSFGPIRARRRRSSNTSRKKANRQYGHSAAQCCELSPALRHACQPETPEAFTRSVDKSDTNRSKRPIGANEAAPLQTLMFAKAARCEGLLWES